ncbi:ABC transporter substrate-binding protein [Meiothermus granaticius]|uniref:Periplasmic dipeptide transport protein n=1 Tax=Meiothermus granaticius NBRC 107808 TaxID=1227551 RepID=A0A399F4Q3_9DEIN|nr:ABC transporter substrate-binding protein [Meiothermus granaticius]MCL6528007.1 ABC transporter substrate-binding protein [Thermaceae bacterium]RIH91664.1 Periplasmic dipeptide transport protein [Meiothermus granaticius NBRC 107808]
MKKAILTGLLAVSLGSALAVVPNNTHVIMQSADIVSLDPTMIYDTSSGALGENIYETLVKYKGKSVSELEPMLATEWKVSPDGKVYTFTLRKGVKFHSGNEMTCADAEYSLRRNLVVNNSDSGNWFLSEALLGTPSNANDDNNITWAKIAKAVACNNQGQLVLTLPAPDPAMLVKLAFIGQAIVDKKWAISLGEWDGTEKTWKEWVGKDLTDSALSNKPSGTGAYQLVRKDASTYVFKAFDNYWGGKPKIENVILQIVKEQAARLEALKKGDADIVETGPRPVLAQLQGAPGLKVYDGIPNNTATAIFMQENIKDPAVLGSGKLDGNGIPANFFSDVNLRKAFAYSFDYDRYIKEVLQGKGTKRTMLLPDSFFGYDPNVKQYSYDPQLATAFFKKAWGGQVWQNGFVLKASYRAGSVAAQTAMEILKANVEKLNPKFKVELQPKQWSEFLKNAQQGKEPMIIVGWAPDYADPDNFLYTFYSSNGYYYPRSGYKDSIMDSLLEQARKTTDRAKRKALYSQVGNRAYETAPYINVPAGVGFVVYRDNIKGLEENYNIMLSGGYYWKDISK